MVFSSFALLFVVFYIFAASMTALKYIHLDCVTSTNAYLLDFPEQERVGCVVYADEQTLGKGMGANTWESAAGENLTFSMGFDMRFLPASQQFLLSQAVPLALLDALDSILLDSFTIKWPNDIYYGTHKVAGVLINSTLYGNHMGTSVVGIGLNVNQMVFRDWPTNPISLKGITGLDFELEPLLHRCADSVTRWVELLQEPSSVARMKSAYYARMMHYHEWAEYEKNGERIRRYIVGLDDFGRLQTLDEQGESCVYDIKELRFVF